MVLVHLHCGQKFWFDRIHADTVGHGVQQNTGQLIGMFFEQFESTLCVVERENDDVVGAAAAGVPWATDPIGSIRITPDCGVGDLADFGVVVAPWYAPSTLAILGRPVNALEALMVTITASVPEFMNRTFRSSGCGNTDAPHTPLHTRWPA